jgi:hypothetical protein
MVRRNGMAVGSEVREWLRSAHGQKPRSSPPVHKAEAAEPMPGHRQTLTPGLRSPAPGIDDQGAADN